MSSHSPISPVGLSGLARTLDGAVALGAQLYYPHRLTPLAHPDEFAFTAVAARLGTATLGLLRYSSAIRIDTDAYVTSVQVNIPLQGIVRTSIGTEHMHATLSRAAVYPHDVPTAISGWEQPCTMLAIKLDRNEVERRLAAEGGRALDLHAMPALDVADGTGARWIAAVRSIIATAQRVRELDAGYAAYLAERCVDGFVLSLLNADSDDDAVPRPVDESIVERAMEAITYTGGPPLSLTKLADHVGLSGRSIQAAFKRVTGETPMQAQRRDRLRRAHRDLRASSPETDQVSTVALRHGFTHFGRFSAQYHSEYGELPSQTLAGSVPVPKTNFFPNAV